jgi:hypothetical protein
MHDPLLLSSTCHALSFASISDLFREGGRTHTLLWSLTRGSKTARVPRPFSFSSSFCFLKKKRKKKRHQLTMVSSMKAYKIDERV